MCFGALVPGGREQTLPGEWLVSDFLLERATEDYDRMAELDDSEIEAIKTKVSARYL